MSEQLNIISDSSKSNVVTGGPNKVIFNTLKGFQKIGQPFVLNKEIRHYKWNWIHDSVQGLINVAFRKIPAVVGPNLVTLPNELPSLLPNLDHLIYLHPSSWPIESWKALGYNPKNILSWPVGIDWEAFDVNRSNNSQKVLIYLKRRNPKLVEKAIEEISKRGFEPIVLKYGFYEEEEYKQVLSEVKFGIWIGISESQGIGLQEALASNLPLIVLDANSFWDEFPRPSYPFPRQLKNFKPTSVPYFSKECGIVINTIEELGNSISLILDNYSLFTPKEFIISNLSLETCAQKFINFFSELNFDFKPVQNNSIKELIINLAFVEYKIRNKIKTLKSIVYK